MSGEHGFRPDPVRARALDARMRRELARSLAHITEQLDAHAEARGLAASLTPVVDRVRSNGRVSPAAFGGYYQLAVSLLDDRPDVAERIAALERFTAPRSELSFKDLSAEGLGDPTLLSLYLGALNSGDEMGFAFLPPTPEQSRATQESVMRGLALMRRTAPDLAGEFEALVIEILLAAASEEPGAARFDGASSYQLWGALALSVDDAKSDLEMMETLAHEAGHSFLFGMTVDEPLVHNHDADLYQSPLRVDPRPMDGIYHATFVSARMHYAMRQARHSGLLDERSLDECDRYLEASAKSFASGHSVVASEGNLSETGRRLMEDAARYMDRAIVPAER